MDDSPPTRRVSLRAHARARLQRQFDRLRGALPWFDRLIARLQSRRAALLRVPVAILMIFGGVFAFLPVLGVWMLPLGIMLLALDVPALQIPVAGVIIRIRRWWSTRRRKGPRA